MSSNEELAVIEKRIQEIRAELKSVSERKKQIKRKVLEARKSRKSPFGKKGERNLAIYEAWQGGKTYAEIGREHGIGGQRVSSICSSVRVQQARIK